MPLLLPFLLTFFSPGCGDDGYRFQLVYATSGVDRSVELAPTFHAVLDQINRNLGDYRRLRVTCGLYVVPVSEKVRTSEIWNVVHPTEQRKYIVFLDGMQTYMSCGSTDGIAIDDRPGADNPNNSGPTSTFLWLNCWFGNIPTHEVFHSLGAVQPSAPYATGDGHCYDPAHLGGIFDCSADSYYDPDPAPGSYLATHWNIASSKFLDVTVPPPPPTVYRVFVPTAALP